MRERPILFDGEDVAYWLDRVPDSPEGE